MIAIICILPNHVFLGRDPPAKFYNMKTLQIFLLAVIAPYLAACSSRVSQSYYTPEQTVSLDIFYTDLSPYGRWIDYPSYGYVWLPDVPVGFSPYLTQGQWVYTRYGWTWASYYAWGWAPFHYGRWRYDVVYGWMWLPDTVWGPAWVAWRRGGGYCGWAPLDFGISVNVVIGGGHYIPYERWIFVRDQYLPERRIERHRVDHARNSELAQTSTIRSQVRQERNAAYMPGPEVAEIQQATRRRINEVAIRERSFPATDRLTRDRLEVYKPEIRSPRPGEQKAAPARVYKKDEIETLSQRQTLPRPSVNRRPEVRQPDTRRQPDARRQPEISRQPRQQQPARRPTRSTETKKRSSGDAQTERRTDRNRRN